MASMHETRTSPARLLRHTAGTVLVAGSLLLVACGGTPPMQQPDQGQVAEMARTAAAEQALRQAATERAQQQAMQQAGEDADGQARPGPKYNAKGKTKSNGGLGSLGGLIGSAPGVLRGSSGTETQALPVRLRGKSLLCTTAQGACQTQRPLESGAACHCAARDGMVAGAAALTVPVGTQAGLAAVVDVFYATDRRKVDATAPAAGFGTKRGPVSYGIAKVTVPASHEMGELEAPPGAELVRLRFLEDARKHVLVASVDALPKEQYFARLRAQVAGSSKADAFVFVHGFNVSFEDALRRTGQIAFDLRFKGAPVLYSWPSKGSPTPLGYTTDSQTVEWSTGNLFEFLRDFLRRTDARNVYLIGHSMGTQALTQSLVKMYREEPELRARISEIILAAPDIDAGIFKRDIAPSLVRGGRPVTVYASSQDRALQLSKLASDYPRAGDSGSGLVLVDGIETIDASNVNTSFLGHSTFADARPVLTDWRAIIDNGLRPAYRGLLQMSSEIPYWQFSR